MIVAEQSSTFEAVVDFGDTGLVGTLGVRIIDNQGATVLARTTAGIIETPAGLGIYSATGLTAPATLGQFTIVWDDGDGNTATEDLLVVAAGASEGSLPPVPADDPAQPQMGPCTSWTTPDDIAACYGSQIVVGSDNEALLEQVAAEASMLLYPLSAHQFTGVCDRTVRPCRTRPGCTSTWTALDRGSPCGCGHLDRVLLPGYPVTEIIEVRIDGDVIDSATYRLDGWRYLSRVRDPADPDTRLWWPACQNLDLDDTHEGTFSVRYLAGVNPPPLGERAAAELAGQLYFACPGVSEGQCKLPVGVQQVTRQGVTMQVKAFTSWGFDHKGREWRTGLRLVDAFLNSVNPTGMRRPPMIWSPDGPQHAQRVGTGSGGS